MRLVRHTWLNFAAVWCGCVATELSVRANSHAIAAVKCQNFSVFVSVLTYSLPVYCGYSYICLSHFMNIVAVWKWMMWRQNENRTSYCDIRNAAIIAPLWSVCSLRHMEYRQYSCITAYCCKARNQRCRVSGERTRWWKTCCSVLCASRWLLPVPLVSRTVLLSSTIVLQLHHRRLCHWQQWRVMLAGSHCGRSYTTLAVTVTPSIQVTVSAQSSYVRRAVAARRPGRTWHIDSCWFALL